MSGTDLAQPDSEATTPSRRDRSATLDSLRGLAIVLVVLSHSWIVWPREKRNWIGPFEALFASGNVAVSVFFVVSGFLVARAWTQTNERYGVAGPLVWFTRRTVRILIQAWLLLVVIYVVNRVDSADRWSDSVTERSLVSAATMTWNHYVRDNALLARSDIGALYFLSIDVQFFSAALLIFILLRRWANILLIVTTLTLLASISWRYVAFHEHGWYFAALSTTTRMDAILWGVLAALAAPRLLGPWREWSTQLVGATFLILAGTVMAGAFYGAAEYFGALGVVTGAAAALLVLADSMREDRDSLIDRILAHKRLTWLGQSSLTIFLWHIPVFEWIATHTPTWDLLPRTFAAIGLLAVIVVIVEQLVSRPLTAATRRWGRPAPQAPTVESVPRT